MGAFFSWLGEYNDTLFALNTKQTVNYQFEILGQLTTAQAAGQQQQLSQLQAIGELGGGGARGGPGAGTPWGRTAANWIWFSNVIHGLAYPIVPTSIVLAVLSIIVFKSPALFTFAAFLLSFFGLYFLVYIAPNFRSEINTGRPLFYALLFSLVITIVSRYLVWPNIQ